MGQIIHEYKGQFYDSNEEVWFAMWCEELRNKGYISSYEKGLTWQLTSGLKLPYIKRTQLKTKVKEEEKSVKLLNDSVYTSDFVITWQQRGIEKFIGFINTTKYEGDPNAVFFNTAGTTHIEVKPTFDQNNMTRLFVNNQKFMWEKHKIFVNLVVVEDLFKETFMPLAAMPDFKIKRPSKKQIAAGKKVGDWKTSYIPKTINEFLC